MSTIPTLELVRESKISELLSSDNPKARWEASGILVKDGFYFVVFDDRTELARIASDLEPNPDNGLFGMADDVTGFEGITFNAGKQRFYLLVEAREHAHDSYQAVLVEYNDEFSCVKSRTLDFPFQSDNKGFEAVAYVRRDDRDFVLALCEGNKCKSGKKGREPGGGRVQIFEKKKKSWQQTGTIALPTTVPFVDYSGMSIDDGRVAIVSQVNSMLWVGQFNEADWTWCDEGRLFNFPRSADDSILYGNIEGVGWLSPTRIVTVSDRRKKSEQPVKALAEKDQSIHIFDIPA
jgi:hypothetical protein